MKVHKAKMMYELIEEKSKLLHIVALLVHILDDGQLGTLLIDPDQDVRDLATDEMNRRDL